jgi:protein TonB
MQTIHALRIAPLDPGRIAATSGAIAINGLLLALLVAPMSAPIVVDAVRETFAVPIPLEEKIVPPPIEEKPIHVEVKPHVPTPTVAPPRLQEHTSPVDPPLPQAFAQPDDVRVTPGDGTTVTDNDGGAGNAEPDDGKPLLGAHLEYETNPAPAYPRDALIDGDTGTVLLQVLVSVDGRPIEVTIARSSGHRVLDVAARRQVMAKWRFRPAMRNGRPVQAVGLVPVEFSLQ